MAFSSVIHSSRSRKLEVREWERREFGGIRLDRWSRLALEGMAESLRHKVRVTELRDGIEVESRSWIGVVSLGAIEIRIRPKLAGEEVGLARLIERVQGIPSIAGFESAVEVGNEEGASLFDLIVLWFVTHVERVLQVGLHSDYVSHDETLGVVRGRINLGELFLKRFGVVDRVPCTFDERTFDIDENRVLLAVLQRVQNVVSNEALRRRVARIRVGLEQSCQLQEFDYKEVRKDLVYDRMNDYYRPAHQLAWIILDSLGLESLLENSKLKAFSFLLDMNRIFEDFVGVWLRVCVARLPFDVQRQVVDRSLFWDESNGRPYSSIRPDYVISSRSGRTGLPIDAKYKSYDLKGVSNADVYQAFVYAYAMGGAPSMPSNNCILFYPSSGGRHVRRSIHVKRTERRRPGRIEIFGLPIRSILDCWDRGSIAQDHVLDLLSMHFTQEDGGGQDYQTRAHPSS